MPEHRVECEQKLHSIMRVSPDTSGRDDDNHTKLNPTIQAQCWDEFHAAHSHGNFFKPRRYIMKCFPCILKHDASEYVRDRSERDTRQLRLILEIGCGSGSSCLPLLEHCEDENVLTKILACDCSAVAVDVCKSVIESSKGTLLTEHFGAFVSDPSLEADEADKSFSEDVKTAHMALLSAETVNAINKNDVGLADVVLMVFVLSAVPPNRVSRFMKQIYDATKKGGKVCFRDYALYDLPMMRFKDTHCVYSACTDSDGAAPRLYERGDGTLSRFFNLETVNDIFRSVGFIVEELKYATVFNDNRKTGERLKRAFVHAVFRKPQD